MITKEQKQKIVYDLMAKNLPLDLLVEVKDHMEEQLDYKIDFENKSFEIAYEEVKKSWEEDLKTKFYLWTAEKRTKLHRDILKKFNSEIWKKSLLILCFYIFVELILFNYFTNILYNFIYYLHVIIILYTLYLVIKNYNIIKTANYSYQKKISYLQKGSSLLLGAGVQILFFIFFNFDKKYTDTIQFFKNIMSLETVNQVQLGGFGILHFFVFLWIFGYLFFVEYKKSVKYLQQKINLKL